MGAFGHGVLHVGLQVVDGIEAVHPHAVFKVVNQTAVVQIDGADHGVLAIGQIAFGVDKAGVILVDFDFCAHQTGIKALYHAEDQLFVGNVRNDDTHIHPTQGGIFNALTQVVVNKIDKVLSSKIGKFAL